MECYKCNKSLKKQFTTVLCENQAGQIYRHYCDEDCMFQKIRDETVDSITRNVKGNQQVFESYEVIVRNGDYPDWVMPMRRVFLSRIVCYKAFLARKPKEYLKRLVDILISKTQEAFDLFDGDEDLKKNSPMIYYELGKWLMPVNIRQLKIKADAWGL